MKKIILFGVPTHENIGDAAIVIAEEKFIKDNFKDDEYIRVLDTETDKEIERIKNIINENDIILLHGGGNLGDEYIICEERRRKVIQSFPNNKIILMPQSIYFNNTECGRTELEKTKELYEKHKNLHLIAREKTSFDIMKKEFKNVDIILTPDIVMYLNKTKDEERNGAVLAMRKDVEKILTEEQFEKINEAVSKYYEDKIITDTHLGDIQIYCDIRENTVEDKLNEFRHAKLVVTDRLHGMIFAAITSTPCIVLGNYNHKIESSYDWLKEQGYIKFVKNVDEIEEKIKAIKNNNKKYCYNNEFAIKQYQKIIDLIRE